jgi:flagellar hook assembly protein FlgD
VQFTLSDSARVSVTVQAGGQVVRTLEQGRSRSRGVQQVVWDGRDAQGRAMPPGNYQVVIQAETEDGQLVRAVAPITLTR